MASGPATGSNRPGTATSEPLQVDEETSLLNGTKNDANFPVFRTRWWLLALPCFALLGVGSILLLLLPVHHYRHIRQYRHQGRHHGYYYHKRSSDSVHSDGENQMHISVAFIGNSMLYFNDIPRLLESLSDGRLTQNSCLHGDATLTTILATGNGMATKFHTPSADSATSSIPDLGACTVPMLLFGRDEQLEQQLQERNDGMNETVYLKDDGTNPCLQNDSSLSDYYHDYLEQHHENSPPHYDFIVINDNTRNPGRLTTRHSGLTVLQSTYVPWLVATKARPVFLDTHAYLAPSRNLTEFVDIPTFTSLTYQGYLEYADLLAQQLPESQQPRIALSGIAFLVVWEEDYALWQQLFHTDQLHCSPTGSYLEGLMIYHALWHELPDPSVALTSDPSRLWERARVLQPADEPPNPFPTLEQTQYLYDVADRVANQGYRPKSLNVNVTPPSNVGGDGSR